MTDPGAAPQKPSWQTQLAFVLVYIILGVFGLRFATITESASPIWLAAGWAVLGVWIWGVRSIGPWVFLGALAVNLTPEGSRFVPAGQIALGNTCEALLGAWLLRQTKTWTEGFGPLGLLLRHLGVMVIAPIPSVATGVWALLQAGLVHSESAPKVVATWWVGNSVGILLILVLFQAWASMPSRSVIWWLTRAAIGVALGFSFATFLFQNSPALSLSGLLIIASAAGLLLSRSVGPHLVALGLIMGVLNLTYKGTEMALLSPQIEALFQGPANTRILKMQSLVVSILIVLPLLVEIARARRVRLLAQILVPAALAHVCLMAGVEMVLKSYEVRLAQADAQAYQEAVDQRWRTVEEALINGQPLGMGPISRGSCHVDDRECLADLRDSGVELQSGLSFASQMLQSGENVTLVAFRSDISHITWATFSSSWFFALEPSDSLLAQVYTRESEKPIYSTSRGHETLQLLSPAVYTDDHAVGVTPIKIAFRTTPTVWSLSTSLVLFLNLVGSLFVSGFVGFLHFAFTINERVEERAEKLSLELRSREAQIVNSAQLGQLGQMAAGIAHEINNPLAIISGRIDMILSRLQKDDIDRARLESDMHKISDTVARVAKIVKSLRVVSRNSEADPMVPVSVRQIFVAVDDLCRDRLARAGVEMRVGEIPNGVLLRGREVQLTQILLNLVGNGLDAVESQADRWIRIDFEVSKKRLIIRVVDSGTGIPEETLRRLMQPFFTTKAVGRGTGLGLSISRGIAQEHGGDLRYRLFQGHTAFELELPISEGQSLTSGKRAASF